jgi:NDP-sugar pyrophosphorylase family protein
MKRKISITLGENTIKEVDNLVDNIYIRNRSQAIELLVNNALGENKTAVILSGGDEEDLRISDKEYRITAKLGGITLIENMVQKLREESFTKIFLVARKKIMDDVFSIIQNGQKYGVNIDYIEEKKSEGTSDTLKYVRGKIKSSFLVIYGDIIFNELSLDEFWNEHIKRKGIVTLLLTTTPEPSKKGVVKIEGSKIMEFIQKPKDSDVYLGFSSMFVAQPELLEYHGSSLEDDVFPDLAKKGLLNGYLSTTRVVKIRTKKNALEIKK